MQSLGKFSSCDGVTFPGETPWILALEVFTEIYPKRNCHAIIRLIKSEYSSPPYHEKYIRPMYTVENKKIENIYYGLIFLTRGITINVYRGTTKY